MLYSRRGLLLKVRGKMGKYRNRYLNRVNLEHAEVENQGSVNLEDIFQLLNLDLESAYGYKINWQEVITPSRTIEPPPSERI
jgi:hypothetical protein